MNSLPERISLEIEGMHCAACATRIESALRELGAEQVSVDFARSSAVFRLPESRSREEAIAVIRERGYSIRDLSVPQPWWNLEKKFLVSCVLTVPLMLPMLFPIHFLHEPLVQFTLSAPVFLIGIIHFGRSAFASLRSGEPNMDVLILLGIVSAYIYSFVGLILALGHDFLFFETSASISTIVLFGNLLEKRAVAKTSSSIDAFSKLQARFANRVEVFQGGERLQEIPIEKVRVGDILVVNTGDRIPSDGVVLDGVLHCDESMLTGESVPVERTTGGTVLCGTIAVGGSARIKVERIGEQTSLAHIRQLVESALSEKPSLHRLADRVSAVFVPAVLAIAVSTLIVNWLAFGLPFTASLLRAIAVLVIACPCAMGLATPTAVVVGIGQAARAGVLLTSGRVLELLSNATSFIFDKTGTLTTGELAVQSIDSSLPESQIGPIVLALEAASSHPIARSLRRRFDQYGAASLREVSETRGNGVSGFSSANELYSLSADDPAGNADIALRKNGDIVARFMLSDSIRSGAADVIRDLNAAGKTTVLLSGDSERRCREIGSALKVAQVFARQSPDQKLAFLQERQRAEAVAFVGDGINDAPALSLATVGISLTSASEVAIQSAQVLLLNGSLPGLSRVLRISDATLTTIRQNLFWAFFYNVLAIPLAACGYLSPTVAALSMAFSDIFVIVNSLRLRLRGFK